MKPNPKPISDKSGEAMMWLVVSSCCFVMIRTAVVVLPAIG